MAAGVEAEGEVIRCPLCIYEQHCGHEAVLGAQTPHGRATNQTIRCLACDRVGERSDSTSLPNQKRVQP